MGWGMPNANEFGERVGAKLNGFLWSQWCDCMCQPCLVLVEVVEALVEPMFWSPHAFPVHCVFFVRVHLHVESLERYMYDLYIVDIGAHTRIHKYFWCFYG